MMQGTFDRTVVLVAIALPLSSAACDAPETTRVDGMPSKAEVPATDERGWQQLLHGGPAVERIAIEAKEIDRVFDVQLYTTLTKAPRLTDAWRTSVVVLEPNDRQAEATRWIDRYGDDLTRCMLRDVDEDQREVEVGVRTTVGVSGWIAEAHILGFRDGGCVVDVVRASRYPTRPAAPLRLELKLVTRRRTSDAE